MSQADIERFIADIKDNAEMLDVLKAGSTGLAHVVDYAESKGYDISTEDAKAYISEQAKRDLTDDQIDQVAAGKGHHHRSQQSTVSTSSSAAAATTNVNVTHTATNTVEAAHSYTTAVIVAEAAAVLT